MKTSNFRLKVRCLRLETDDIVPKNRNLFVLLRDTLYSSVRNRSRIDLLLLSRVLFPFFHAELKPRMNSFEGSFEVRDILLLTDELRVRFAVLDLQLRDLIHHRIPLHPIPLLLRLIIHLPHLVIIRRLEPIKLALELLDLLLLRNDALHHAVELLTPRRLCVGRSERLWDGSKCF